MSELIDEQADSPRSHPVNRGTRLLPAAVALLSMLVFVVAAPFAKMPLPQVPAFIPVYESALILNDLITSVLLFGQCVIARSRALGALASGYLYTSAIALLHMLSFPGLFSPTGLLNAGPQSTAWIYMFWHAGFPLFVIAYALLKDKKQSRTMGNTVGSGGLVFVVGTVLCLAAGMVGLATAGERLLPEIILNNHYTPTMRWVAGSTWGFCLLAFAVLYRQRWRSTIDLWLMVVLCVWICDVALSAVFNGGRYDLGFYIGRFYGMCAASFVLLLLLVENTFLHSRLAAALDELKRLATTDPLTGVANRRAFDAALTAHWQRGVKDRSTLSLLMIDIDFFKRFNDRYGHVEGDRCLVLVAECLARTVRRGSDLVARYGGEEFVALLPETDAESAVHVGQRMCDAVAALAIPNAGSPPMPSVTISVGVASRIIETGVEMTDLTKAADHALYLAKAAGRGRVEEAVLTA
ncbi:GGDEF domain-containing protein [Caballeronia sp. SEWSISQ10-4 2]|uniref:sensor domain-containing diguanylate cyclase n=1 Tax=Caballeronia sp. SEWSISQ10-4 2 TaxID=2937438 RepID=UPI0026542DEE|nr:sensor domain-containing diguanylate cyclase [Caballeronia sp. SEWSISQ10-4 2]MDN7180330.1 GGDEF domain-containing protein [Caballeronia sp. SEWSISQ10-4 2]